MRLFTGIEPSREVVNGLVPMLERVKGVPAENLHITTKFIGAWPEERLAELKEALTKTIWPGAFRVKFGGLVFLSKALAIEVHAGPELAELARRTDEALETLGCVSEARVYRPHLTLARPKHDNIGELRRTIGKMGTSDFGSFNVTEFHLYSSRTGPRGAVYTKVGSWQIQ